MANLANLPTTVVVTTHGRQPRMLHLPDCSHLTEPSTVTRSPTDAERRTLRECTTCGNRLSK